MRVRPSEASRQEWKTHMFCVCEDTVSYGTEFLSLGKCNISSESVLMFTDMASRYSLLVKLWKWVSVM